MTDLISIEPEESQDVGSLNHSFTQARLTTLLSHEERFTTFVELSLDVSQIDLTPFRLKTKEEFKPAVCLYETVSGYPEPDPLFFVKPQRA